MANQDSITPSLAGEIWLKSIRHPFLNRPVKLLDRGQPVERDDRDGVFPVSGRSTPIAIHDVKGAHAFTHYVMTTGPNHLAEARDFDLTLASGETFFLHLPSGSRAQGGYIAIGQTSQERLYYASDTAPQVFELPCRVVTKPGPDVVGTTMTWGTVERLYGSWTQLLASNSTWIDLFVNVGSPEDLVIL